MGMLLCKSYDKMRPEERFIPEEIKYLYLSQNAGFEAYNLHTHACHIYYGLAIEIV